MPFFGELFVSDLLKKPVLDPKGEELGKVRDIVMIKGEPFPKVSALIIEKKKKLFNLPWNDLNIFNKRIISAQIYSDVLRHYDYSETDLLIVRDI
ncbi:MAG: MgtE intracellular region, partial [Nitrospirae bacterium]|nr:MgtE intracellular region [Nitrospirota bacterium]